MDSGDFRAEAAAALLRGPFDSFVAACKVLAGSVAVSVGVATGLNWLGKFSLAVLGGMAASCASATLGGFFLWELDRLNRCRTELEHVLQSGKLYEDLLREAREERDRARGDRIELEARLAVQAQLFDQAGLLALLRARPALDGQGAELKTDGQLERKER